VLQLPEDPSGQFVGWVLQVWLFLVADFLLTMTMRMTTVDDVDHEAKRAMHQLFLTTTTTTWLPTRNPSGLQESSYRQSRNNQDLPTTEWATFHTVMHSINTTVMAFVVIEMCGNRRNLVRLVVVCEGFLFVIDRK
jgi:hypothetical protein